MPCIPTRQDLPEDKWRVEGQDAEERREVHSVPYRRQPSLQIVPHLQLPLWLLQTLLRSFSLRLWGLKGHHPSTPPAEAHSGHSGQPIPSPAVSNLYYNSFWKPGPVFLYTLVWGRGQNCLFHATCTLTTRPDRDKQLRSFLLPMCLRHWWD